MYLFYLRSTHGIYLDLVKRFACCFDLSNRLTQGRKRRFTNRFLRKLLLLLPRHSQNGRRVVVFRIFFPASTTPKPCHWPFTPGGQVVPGLGSGRRKTLSNSGRSPLMTLAVDVADGIKLSIYQSVSNLSIGLCWWTFERVFCKLRKVPDWITAERAFLYWMGSCRTLWNNKIYRSNKVQGNKQELGTGFLTLTRFGNNLLVFEGVGKRAVSVRSSKKIEMGGGEGKKIRDVQVDYRVIFPLTWANFTFKGGLRVKWEKNERKNTNRILQKSQYRQSIFRKESWQDVGMEIAIAKEKWINGFHKRKERQYERISVNPEVMLDVTLLSTHVYSDLQINGSEIDSYLRWRENKTM